MAHTILAYLTHFQQEMSERIMPRKPSLESIDDVTRNQSATNKPSVLTSVLNDTKRYSAGKDVHLGMNGSFDFRHGSIGNFMISGCRLFFKSLEYVFVI